MWYKFFLQFGMVMRFQKKLFALTAVFIITVFLGIYGHAAIDDHGAEDVCQICLFLQAGASVSVVCASV